MCLATGETPVPAYAHFASSVEAPERMTVLLLDEFAMPPGHPARCDEMIRRTLLDLLPRSPRALHTLDVAAPDLEGECARYEAVIADGGIDLAVLGLGSNGHLALNEPGSGVDSRTRRVELAPETVAHAETYGAGARPSWGLTMGIATILDAKRIWLLVTGAHKAATLAAVMRGPVGPDVPATYLRDHPAVTVLADEPAAGRVC